MTTITHKEALKLAREVLAEDRAWLESDAPQRVWDANSNAMIAIDEALAQPEQDSVSMADYMAIVEKYAFLKASQPEQEPVAWITKTGSVWKTKWDDSDIPLYTTPPPVAEPHKRKPLTDEQIDDAIDAWFDCEGKTWRVRMRAAIEAAHGITQS